MHFIMLIGQFEVEEKGTVYQRDTLTFGTKNYEHRNSTWHSKKKTKKNKNISLACY